MLDPAMTAFLDGCGSAGPLILGIESQDGDPATVSWRVLDQPFAVLGRGATADISLRHPDLSRRHAYFQLVGGRLFCVDLHSRTGTFWGEGGGPWGWVEPGASVGVGPYWVRRRLDRSEAAALRAGGGPSAEPGRRSPVPVSRSYDPPVGDEITLEVGRRGVAATPWRMSRTLVLIGRSPSCKVRLDDAGLAQVHASLVRTPAGLFAVDLLGPGGLRVNGRSTRWARLEADDVLTLGDHTVRVRMDRAAAATSLMVRPSGRPAGSTPPVPVEADRVPSVLPAVAADEQARAFVRLMVGELGQAQQHAADRFQETLLTVVQSFVAMQRDQMELIREEIAALRQLAEEQQALQVQVDRWAEAGRGPVTLRLVSGDSRPAIVVPAPGGPPARRDAGQPRPEGGAAVPARGTEPAAEAAFHSQVFERLAAIQGESQSRWQRLKESLLGK